jgi:hypothetical protein
MNRRAKSKKDMRRELAQLKLRIAKVLMDAKKNGIKAEDLLAKAISLSDLSGRQKLNQDTAQWAK